MAIKQDVGKVLVGTTPTIDKTQGTKPVIGGVVWPENIDIVGIPRGADMLERLTVLMTAAQTVDTWTIEMNSEFQMIMREIGTVLANTSVEGLRGVANGTEAPDATALGTMLAAILAM